MRSKNIKTNLFVVAVALFIAAYCVGCKANINYEPPLVKEEGKNTVITDGYFGYSSKVDKSWKVTVIAKDKDSISRYKVTDRDDVHAVYFLALKSDTNNIDIKKLHEFISTKYSLGTAVNSKYFKKPIFGTKYDKALEVTYEKKGLIENGKKKLKYNKTKNTGKPAYPNTVIKSLCRYSISGNYAFVQIAQAKDDNFIGTQSVIASVSNLNGYNHFMQRVLNYIKPIQGLAMWKTAIKYLLLVVAIYCLISCIYLISFVLDSNRLKYKTKKSIKRLAVSLMRKNNIESSQLKTIIEALYKENGIDQKQQKMQFKSVLVYLLYSSIIMFIICSEIIPIPIPICILFLLPFILLGIYSKRIMLFFKPFTKIPLFIPIPVPSAGSISDAFDSISDSGGTSGSGHSSLGNTGSLQPTHGGSSGNRSVIDEMQQQGGSKSNTGVADELQRQRGASAVPSSHKSGFTDLPQKSGGNTVLDDKLSRTSSNVAGESRGSSSSSQLDDKLSRTDSSR